MGLKIIFSIFAFILGACFASFAGVVAYRVPKKQSIVKPDSYCPSCGKDIKAYDNIPVLSYIILLGKCRFCKSKIGLFNFLCELFGGLGFLFAYIMYGQSLKTLPIMAMLVLLIFLFLVIAGIDYETHDIYNVTLILFAVLSLSLTLYRVLVLKYEIWDYIFGLLLGFTFFGLVWLVGRLVMKREALGSGDIYLVGIAGFMLGAFPLLLSILVSTLIGSVIELIKIKFAKSSRGNEIAFGPYLLLGIGVMAVFGEKIMEFYWRVVL